MLQPLLFDNCCWLRNAAAFTQAVTAAAADASAVAAAAAPVAVAETLFSAEATQSSRNEIVQCDPACSQF